MAIGVEIINAKETSEGDSVTVKRLFPSTGKMNFDPFVLWDHFTIQPGSGFPEHPHRGFEAMTYLFSGSMEHRDNLGNQASIDAGGVQRFTAGKGISHSEMPGDEGLSEGIQLWVNSTRADKLREPDYQQLSAAQLPVSEFEHGKVITIVGEGSPLALLTPVIYLHVMFTEAGEHTLIMPSLYHGVCYVVSGAATINDHAIKAGQASLSQYGGKLSIKSEHASQMMIAYGQPHRQPIYQHGSFVD